MKLLIADDEPIVRNGIANSIQWRSKGFTEVYTAEDGLVAYEKTKELKIDVLIADIRMPGMDGLELIKKVRELDDGIKVVILTAYDDFNYAREAVNLGAFDYLLKPVDSNLLMETVLKARDARERELNEKDENDRIREILKDSMPELQERFFNSLLKGEWGQHMIKRAEYLNIHIDDIYSFCIAALPENIDDMSEEETQIEVFKLRRSIEDYIDDLSLKGYVTEQPGCVQMLILNGYEDRERTTGLWEKIGNELYDYLTSKGFKVTVGVGNIVDTISRIHKSGEQAINATGYRFYMGRCSTIYLRDMEPPRDDVYQDIYETIESLLPFIKMGEKEKVNKEIDTVFKRIGESMVPISTAKRWIFEIVMILSRSIYELNENPDMLFQKSDPWREINSKDTIEELKEWLDDLIVTTIEYIELRKSSRNKGIVDKIYKIIEDKFADQSLNLSTIADTLHYTPNYISFVFKQVTGENFTDFLTKYRVEKAKKLLTDRNTKIYTVSLEVGYADPKYFSKIFKKITGYTPAEFREIIQR
ncbi:MAG: response regulator [Thermoanaerobacteraceae bacterium]|nr:response regulator [Thermoanaerobacteraceae bacterium]